jgi:hypothetical protein
MSETNNVTRLLPLWSISIGAIARSNALLRSACTKCHCELREDPHALAAVFGGSFKMDGYRARCRQIGCDGAVTFKTSRIYGQQWIALDGNATAVPRRRANILA